MSERTLLFVCLHGAGLSRMAAAFLDAAPPRPIGAVPDPARVVALRNPAVRYELAGAETWDLAHAEGVPLRDEIRARVEPLARSLASESPASAPAD